MPSSPTAGYQGIFKVGSTALVQVVNFELNIAGETYDVTIMNGLTTPAWKAFLAGLLSYDIKVMANYDQVNDAVQATLWTDITTGVTIAWSFSPNAAAHTYSGNAILKAVPMKFPVNNKEDIEWDLQGTGAISYV